MAALLSHRGFTSETVAGEAKPSVHFYTPWEFSLSMDWDEVALHCDECHGEILGKFSGPERNKVYFCGKCTKLFPKLTMATNGFPVSAFTEQHIEEWLREEMSPLEAFLTASECYDELSHIYEEYFSGEHVFGEANRGEAA